MIRNRRHRLATVLFALLSLLFMQLAIAGYSCPGGAPDKAMEMGAMEMGAMAQSEIPCASSMDSVMDADQPGLCQAHCQADPQTASKYQLPELANVSDLATDFPLPRVIPSPQGASLQAPLLRRSTAPSLAVRHCCFRI